MKTTPAGALMHHARTRPKSAAFVFREEVWTYERLAAEAELLAHGLAARGVGPGDRVALHMMSRPEMVVAYYACFQLGVIAAPLRTAFKFAELASILHRLKPVLYIGEMGLYDNVAPVDTSILAPNNRFIVNGTFEDDGVQPWEALFDEATDKSLSVFPAPYEPAVLIITSGTTGLPKFAIHTPATLSETVDLITKHGGFSDDVMIESLPMAHISGLFSFLTYIQFGAAFVLLEGSDADTVIDAIERSEIFRNVATRLASYKVPDGLRIIDELSRNALSKIDRNMLQTMALRADKAGRPRIEEAPLAAKTTRRTAGPVGCSQQIDSSLGTERRVAPAVGVTGFARTTS
jgi:acyl-CoA synthetase (AMP-forming)/AMP-acid ligase II